MSKSGSCFNYCIESHKNCFNVVLPFFINHPIPNDSFKAFNLTCGSMWF